MGSEKEEVESHIKFLCLDGDLDVLYCLLEKRSSLTKKKAKELKQYTINLDFNIQKSIALGRSRLFQCENLADDRNYDETDGTATTSNATSANQQSEQPNNWRVTQEFHGGKQSFYVAQAKQKKRRF